MMMTTANFVTPEKPRLILITGIMAAGKSTVAQHLAERLPKSVHLRGDLFRRMIVNGQAQMGFDLSAEALAQLKLRYQIAATVADLYLDAGFSVVYQDILIANDLAEFAQRARRHPVHVVVLCPQPDTVAVREANRSKTGYSNVDEIAAFDRVLRNETPRLGLWLDSTRLTVEETVGYILANLAQALVYADKATESA
jgi:predicted kinase